MAIQTLNIIGAGAVGKTLGRAFHVRGVFNIYAVTNRSLLSADAAVNFINAGRPERFDWNLDPADVTMIAVSDDQIAECADDLAFGGPDVDGKIVFHVSGGETSALLKPLADKGALTASIHPIKTFANPEMDARFMHGVICGVEGHPVAVEKLTSAFNILGMRVVPIDPAKKMLYHAGAVFACNYLTALLDGYTRRDSHPRVIGETRKSLRAMEDGLRPMYGDLGELFDAALRCYAMAGMRETIAKTAVIRIARETVTNIETIGFERALTGPISRGSRIFLEKQYAALRGESANTAHLYRGLGELTIDLAARGNRITPDTAQALRRVLSPAS